MLYNFVNSAYTKRPFIILLQSAGKVMQALIPFTAFNDQFTKLKIEKKSFYIKLSFALQPSIHYFVATYMKHKTYFWPKEQCPAVI